jgi:AraC-like DNA-binding protein
MIAAQPQTTLADIAVFCGFESYSQFIAAFRKSYDLTPSGYRRMLEQVAE